MIHTIANTNEPEVTKWHLQGATYSQFNQPFGFVGDYENGDCFLNFLVNEKIRSVKIPNPLKSLDTICDEIKNGVLYYRIDMFTVDHTNLLYIEPYWKSDESTICFFVPLPYGALRNGKVKCDKLPTVYTSITNSNTVGVKAVGTVLAVRLLKADCDIIDGDSREKCISKLTAYLKYTPLTILCEREYVEGIVLEDYSFKVVQVDNTIVCTNTYQPLSFLVEYPLEVVINTTVDIRQIQAIGSQVAQDRLIVQNLKLEVENSIKLATQQYESILQIESTLNQQYTEIQTIKIQIDELTHSIETIYSDIETKFEALNILGETITAQKIEIDRILEQVKTIQTQIQTQIQNQIQAHNQDKNAHLDIRALIQSQENIYHEINDTVKTHTAKLSELNEIKKLHNEQIISLNNITEMHTTQIVSINENFVSYDHQLETLKISNDDQNIHIKNLESLLLDSSSERIALEKIPFLHEKLVATNLLEALNELIVKLYPS